MKLLRLVYNQGLLCLADSKTLPHMCGADRRWTNTGPRYQEALPARLRLPQVTWPVSWSSAHPPDLLLFTNQHTVYKSRMKSPAWSVQVSGNYMTMCVCTVTLILTSSRLLVHVFSVGLGNCVRSRNRPADRLACNLLTAELTSRSLLTSWHSLLQISRHQQHFLVILCLFGDFSRGCGFVYPRLAS